MKAHPTSTYALAAPATWALVRAAYLSGLSGPSVAARFGVSLSALRKRAQREGWTKTAYALTREAAAEPQAPAPPRPEPPPSLPPAAEAGLPRLTLHPLAVARQALEGAARALAEGRPAEALAGVRAAEGIVRLGELVPDVGEVESAEAAQARHALLREAVFEMAAELAGQLASGAEVGARYAGMAKAWRAKNGAGGPKGPYGDA
ncbi:MAG: hypothetical protein IT546_14045 [Caulobacteraceae bacterium]|nr:hypothetical protein [Caulobacteraceae bacterium]